MSTNRPPPLSCVMLELLTVERVELYSWVPPPGYIIPFDTYPFPIGESILSMDKIEWLV